MPQPKLAFLHYWVIQNIFSFLYILTAVCYSHCFCHISSQRMIIYQFSAVPLLSRVSLFWTTWTAACQASLSITNFQSLLKVINQVSVAIKPSHPLLSPYSGFNLSQQQGLFQWFRSSYKVAKYWSFSFSTWISNEYSGLISFKTDWFNLLAV